jgi:hypothetical protein
MLGPCQPVEREGGGRLESLLKRDSPSLGKGKTSLFREVEGGGEGREREIRKEGFRAGL